MSRENLENITAIYFAMYAPATGRIKILEYPAVQSGHWRSWDIWTIAISLAVGVIDNDICGTKLV